MSNDNDDGDKPRLPKPKPCRNQNGGVTAPPLVTSKPATRHSKTARERIADRQPQRQRQFRPVRALWLSANGEQLSAAIHGREAQTLRALVAAGARGLTSLEMGSWAIRLASYIHDLRHVYGLPIHTERESHTIAGINGRHGRYRLQVTVRLIELTT